MPQILNPLKTGTAGETRELLDELDAYLLEKGVDTKLISAREVTTLRKSDGRPSSIPDREYWPGLANVCLYGFMPLRLECDFPLIVLNGYRPEFYNSLVRGHRRSQHLFARALDLAPVTRGLSGDDVAYRRERLAMATARLFKEHGYEHGGMGFGAYGRKPCFRVHIDIGRGRRRWRDANFWWNLLKTETPPEVRSQTGSRAAAAVTVSETKEPWWAVFGLTCSKGIPLEAVEVIYRDRLQSAHPDRGGTDEETRGLHEAIEQARAELG